jgi:hypothetical protein
VNRGLLRVAVAAQIGHALFGETLLEVRLHDLVGLVPFLGVVDQHRQVEDARDLHVAGEEQVRGEIDDTVTGSLRDIGRRNLQGLAQVQGDRQVSVGIRLDALGNPLHALHRGSGGYGGIGIAGPVGGVRHSGQRRYRSVPGWKADSVWRIP